MGMEKLEGQHHGGGQEKDEPSGLERFFQKIECPGREGDGGDLHDVPGVDQRRVFRRQREDEAGKNRSPSANFEQTAKTIGTGGADEELDHDVPGDIGGCREDPENKVAQEQELLRDHPPLIGVPGVDEEVPSGAGEINLEDGRERPHPEILHPPVELVDDVRGADDLCGEEDLREAYKEDCQQRGQYQQVFLTVSHAAKNSLGRGSKIRGNQASVALSTYFEIPATRS